MKKATIDIVRLEYEYPIPVADAQELLDKLCQGYVVEKTRHEVEFGGRVWEVDVFDGVNEGLVIAELELEDEHAHFERPPWLGAEVSGDARYLNTHLSRHPFREW